MKREEKKIKDEEKKMDEEDEESEEEEKMLTTRKSSRTGNRCRQDAGCRLQPITYKGVVKENLTLCIFLITLIF